MYMNGVFMVQEEVITEDHPHRENGKIEKSLKESEPLDSSEDNYLRTKKSQTNSTIESRNQKTIEEKSFTGICSS